MDFGSFDELRNFRSECGSCKFSQNEALLFFQEIPKDSWSEIKNEYPIIEDNVNTFIESLNNYQLKSLDQGWRTY